MHAASTGAGGHQLYPDTAGCGTQGHCTCEPAWLHGKKNALKQALHALCGDPAAAGPLRSANLRILFPWSPLRLSPLLPLLLCPRPMRCPMRCPGCKRMQPARQDARWLRLRSCGGLFASHDNSHGALAPLAHGVLLKSLRNAVTAQRLCQMHSRKRVPVRAAWSTGSL